MDDILENRAIGSLARYFSPSPNKINRLHESDAELVALAGEKSRYLAVTIDTIADEITQGLYRDPYTIGWVTVMASLSDLAAVGANPVGLVTALSLEIYRDETFRSEMARGMEEACRQSETFLLGGDLNMTDSISLTACAIGTVPAKMKLTRMGCLKGDVVFLSGKAGIGNALGLARKANLTEDVFPEKAYRPRARLKEGQLIRKFATSCMDTSDGLFITIDQLIRLNEKGYSIKVDWEDVLKPEVLHLCASMKIPRWFMAAGIHGEFELVFTIPAKEVQSFLEQAQKMNFHPIALGKIIDEPRFEITPKSQKTVVIDMTPLRNLWENVTEDISVIIEQHHLWGKKWGLN